MIYLLAQARLTPHTLHLPETRFEVVEVVGQFSYGLCVQQLRLSHRSTKCCSDTLKTRRTISGEQCNNVLHEYIPANWIQMSSLHIGQAELVRLVQSWLHQYFLLTWYSNQKATDYCWLGISNDLSCMQTVMWVGLVHTRGLPPGMAFLKLLSMGKVELTTLLCTGALP